VRKDPEFGYVQEDIVRLKSKLEEKSVSLNERKRMEEKKAIVERLEKRKRERQKRNVPTPAVTEITLQSLDGVSSNTPALTKKVLDEANALLRDSSDEDLAFDSTVDPEFEESLNILSDLISFKKEETTRP